jgi:co-chaperonin GroES (HSP10)
VSDDNNRVEDLYICEHRHIFGRLRDGIFTPVEDWVFCEPIPYEGEERSSGLLVPHLISGMTQKGFEGQIIGKWHPSEAIVRYVPRFWQNQLKKGDRISFIRNADYDMKVEGEVLFRINAEHIMYTV